MWIIGCDYHPRFQQIAFVNTETGEYGERRLEHAGEAEQFYRTLAGQPVRVGMEASGQARWFERLLAELGYELWIGDPGKIRAAATRKQKTDRRDAAHILELLLSGQFEKLRIWVPTAEQRDVRQLVMHRHRLVQMRTRVKNQLRSVALNEGLGRKPGLWSKKGQERFQALPLPTWTAQRRQDNLELLGELEKRTAPLDQAVEREGAQRPEVGRLRTHPGVGPITALAFVLTIGDPKRFDCGKQVASYLGLIPAENSSGGSGWGISASKAMRCCGACWWKRRTVRRSTMPSWGAATGGWPTRRTAPSRPWRWRASWRYGCGGCGNAESAIKASRVPVRMQGKSGLTDGAKLVLDFVNGHPASLHGEGV